MTELFKFFILTGIIFFMFLAIGNILLYDTHAFNTMPYGAVILFGAGLGVFDYADVSDTAYPYVGHIYFTLFLIIMAIILLNFIIAILTDIYSEIWIIGKALYLKEAILLYHWMGMSSTDTWRVSAFVPLNLLIYFIGVPLNFMFKSWTQ